MITERPLKDVPEMALYALHGGIERQRGLIFNAFLDEDECCAIGSLASNGLKSWPRELALRCFELGLVCDKNKVFDLNEAGCAINNLNSSLGGTPEERREFMLRHIVEELRHRGKSLPNKSDQAPKILTNETR